MMREKISPSLAAVSPPSSLCLLCEQVVSLDNRVSRFQEVDPQWGTDRRPAPGHPHNDVGTCGNGQV